MDYYMLAAAILPAILLLIYVYRRDEYQREPVAQIAKGFVWGIVSAILVLMSAPLTEGLRDPQVRETFTGCFQIAFFGAAIPEECAKALCLYLFLRHNRWFDEYMDGIVYAASIGMGFAAFENVLYLANAENWVLLGLQRGLISVPAHFIFAVIMGYYFSQWRMRGELRAFGLMLLLPIVVHGLFDFILYLMGLSETFATMLTILFALGLRFLRQYCDQLIKNLLTNDVNEGNVTK